MMELLQWGGWIVTIFAALAVGKLVSKLRLPAILGWLMAGMALGPHGFQVMSQPLLDDVVYQNVIHLLECAVGLMIGTELVWSKLRKTGKQILVTTLTQSLGTFLLVSLVFDIIFYWMGYPLYLGFLFGGIALATAPAPALSIVREFGAKGPVTDTLLPMAALDDMVAVVVFFTTVSLVSVQIAETQVPASLVVLTLVLPLVIGSVIGLLGGAALKRERGRGPTMAILCGLIAVVFLVGWWCNAYVMPRPILNFMLMGMAFSAVFANCISPERLEQIMAWFSPVLGIGMVTVILNLGAPLDYHLILGAGLFTAVYILARAAGKYCGARFGAAITGAPVTVRKYLGLTLLPHSGVSLVFTGIAVSVLSGPAPECAQVIQGTIAAAAVINEVIAVIVAQKAFGWAGELHGGQNHRPPMSAHAG